MPAPSEAAASSISRSSSMSTGCTDRTTKGSVTKSNARNTAAGVYATLIPTGLFGPYNATSVSPATIVGSANGKSMSALTNGLPQKSSRTSTHARSVPATPLTNATPSDATRLNRRLARASAANTSLQKEPPVNARAATAASGSSTITLKKVVTMPAGRSESLRAALFRTATRSPRMMAALVTTRYPERLFDLCDLAVLRIEEFCLHGPPSAEVVDVEQRVGLREPHVRG